MNFDKLYNKIFYYLPPPDNFKMSSVETGETVSSSHLNQLFSDWRIHPT